MTDSVDERLRLINEVIKKQLEDAGVDLQDLVPDMEKLIQAIQKQKAKKRN